MSKIQATVLIMDLLFTCIAGAEDKQAPEIIKKIEPLPRKLEMQFALSALLLHHQAVKFRRLPQCDEKH